MQNWTSIHKLFLILLLKTVANWNLNARV